MNAISKWMICRKAWLVETNGGKITVGVGDKIMLDSSDFKSGTVLAHFGGILMACVTIETLLEYTRIAESHEIISELKQCPQCARIFVNDKWVHAPMCFRPRENTKIIHERCPDCDK